MTTPVRPFYWLPHIDGSESPSPKPLWKAFASIVLLGFSLLSGPLWSAEVGDKFPSVDAFVGSRTMNMTARGEGSFGDLTGTGHRDWAGVVKWDDAEGFRMRQVAVLAQLADGQYRVEALGPEEGNSGGTGQHFLEMVEIRQGSAYLTWSWHWHGCAGGSTHQIKLYKNQWRVIGAEFNQSTSFITPDGGYDVGDSATMSHNLLTGAGIIYFKPRKGKAIKVKLQGAPSTQLLDADYSENSGSRDEFSSYAGC